MKIRSANTRDLPAINRVIEAAVMTWQLPERVKRLALPSYRYDATDLQHLTVKVIESPTSSMVALAAWEAADPSDTPGQQPGLLLHGLYVHPDFQRQGIGQQLLQAAATAAQRTGHYAGLLVKAQTDAESFFAAQGLEKLPVTDATRHYGNRYWLAF